MNSLIQAMYMTPEFRHGLLSIDLEELGLLNTGETETETQKLDTFEIDNDLLQSLISMGIHEIGARKALVATKNGTYDLIFDFIEKNEHNSDFNLPPPTKAVDNSVVTLKKKRKPRYIPLELQYLFTQLKLVDRLAVSTKELTTKGFEWQGVDGQVQHDAHELNRLLIDAIEKSLKRTSGEKLCESLYMGKVANTIRCSTCSRVSEREESFYDCNLQIIDCPGLVESLRRFCAAEVLQGDSSYQCDICKAKRTALRSVVLRSLPPILTFSCNRFRIDQSTQWQRVKVTARSEFPLLIDMSAFMESNAYNINSELTSDVDKEMELISSLKTHTIQLKDVVEKAKNWANTLYEIYGTTCDNFFHCNNAVHEELSSDTLNAIRDDMVGNMNTSRFGGELVYKLHAVIMHRGSAYSGHYFAYIRDSMREGHWEMPESSKETPHIAVVKANQSQSAEQPTASSSQQTSVPDINLSMKKMYFKDERNKRCFIIKDTPVGVVVSTLMYAKQSQLAASHLAFYPIPFGRLGRDIISLTKLNWAQNFKTSFGSLSSFIRLYNEVILVQENNQSPKNPFVRIAPSIDDYEVLLVGEIEFTMALVSSQSDQQTAVPIESERVTNVDDFMHRGDQMDYVDSDEAFAKAIQSSLEAEDLKSSTQAPTEEDKWEVAGVKKKEKKAPSGGGKQKQQPVSGMKNKPIQVTGNKANRKLTASSSKPAISAVEEATAINTAIEESLRDANAVTDADNDSLEEEKHKQGIISHLKNRILNKYFGPFFNFNDSIVTPMELSALEKSFEGPDSAYLLVYRKENIMDFDRPVIEVPPPSVWSENVQLLNKELAEERTNYETGTHTIIITIRCPAHMCVDKKPSPLLLIDDSFKETPTTPEDVVDKGFITMEFDGRYSFRELIAEFVKEYKDKLSNLGLADLISADPINFSQLQINLLDSYTRLGGFHVSKTIDLSSAISDAVLARSEILIWNGKSIQQSPVLAGPAAAPVTLAVFNLHMSSSNELIAAGNRRMQSKAEVKNRLVPFCVPFAMYLSDICAAISSQCGMTSSQCSVYVVLYENFVHRATNKTTETAKSDVNSVGKRRNQVVAFNLFERGVLSASGKNILSLETSTKDKQSVQSSQSSIFADTCVGELIESLRRKSAGSVALDDHRNSCDLEVWVEDYEARGLASKSVAELMADQWNNEVTLTISLHFDPLKLNDLEGTTMSDESALTGKRVKFDVEVEETVKTISVEVNVLHTLREVKQKALLVFSLDTDLFLEALKFQYDGVFCDESLRVMDCGLGEGSKLQLHPIDLTDAAVQSSLSASDGEFSVKVVQVGLLESNDQGRPGLYHINESMIAVQKTTTITALRDAAAVALLNYSPGWTVSDTATTTLKSDVVVKPMRLRRTTWMGEAAELLLESKEGSTAGSWVGTTVESVGLREGDTLLLEEGLPPVKGLLSLKVFVWEPHQYNASKSADSMPEVTETQLSPPLPATLHPAEEALNAVYQKKLQCLRSLGDVTALSSDSIEELYKRLHTLLIALPEYVTVPLNRILIRELRSDMLPGKSFWTSFHSTATPQTDAANKKVFVAQDMSQLLGGIGNKAAPKDKLKPKDTPAEKSGGVLSLKRCGLAGDKSVVVELLPLLGDGSVQMRPPQDSFRVWVQRLANPGCKEGEAAMEPEWPPLQVLVSGGATPTLGHLKRAFSAAAASASAESLEVFKLLSQAVQWTRLLTNSDRQLREMLRLNHTPSSSSSSSSISSGATGSPSRVGRGSGGGGKKAENISQGPYFVKEGDQFCVFSGTAHSNPTSNQVKVNILTWDIAIARPEDVCLRQLKQEEKQRKEEAKRTRASDHIHSGGVTGTLAGIVSNKPVRKEALLTIGRWGSYSDDEEEEDVQGNGRDND